MTASSCNCQVSCLSFRIQGTWEDTYVLNGEVGDTDGAGLGLGQLSHGLPGLDDGDVLVEDSLGAISVLGEETVAGGEGNRPVDEVELRCKVSEPVGFFLSLVSFRSSTYIEVVEAKLLKGVVQSRSNVLGGVRAVPQLGGDEDVLALQAGDISQSLLDALADLLLVGVHLGQIEVAVADLEGLVDTGANLARGGLPGAVADLGDLVAGVEGDSSSGRHFCGGDAERSGEEVVGV